MNWADWLIIAILAVSVGVSALRGFVREALSLVVWIVAFIVAMSFYQSVSPWFIRWIETPSLRLVAAWGTLFLAVLLVGGLANYLLAQLVLATGLSGTDRLLGTVFGLARGLIIVMILLLMLSKTIQVHRDPWWQESLLIPYLMRFENMAMAAADEVINFFKRWM